MSVVSGVVIAHAVVLEDSGVTYMSHTKGPDSADITQAAMQTITFGIYDTADDSEIDAGALVIGDTVFDTLQTDGRWTEDSTGYNFRHAIDSTQLPTGGKTYRVEYTFTPADGSKWKQMGVIRTVNLIGS